MEKLKNSHVCVLGVGGVGSWAVEALARSYVGKLTLMDMDTVCESNINRQLHALTENIGNFKTEAMKERIASINPECEVETFNEALTQENLAEFVDRGYDYVIDAIDSLQVKAALIAYCKRNKIKLITSGGAGGKTDPSKIQIADLSKTIQDPLASKLRNILRKEYNFSKNPKRKFGVECVFSSEPPQLTELGFGTVTFATGSFGFFAASRVIDKLLK